MKAADARTSFERIMQTPPGYAYARMTRHHTNMVMLQAIGLSAAEKLVSVMTHEPGAPPTAIDFGNPKEFAVDVLTGAVPIAAKDMFTQQVRTRSDCTRQVAMQGHGSSASFEHHRANPL
jgi:hypothetical protein